MDRILIILKKENGPRASSVLALWLNAMICQHVYWYMQQISGERLQDHWSSCLSCDQCKITNIILKSGKNDISIHVGLLIQERLIIIGTRLI